MGPLWSCSLITQAAPSFWDPTATPIGSGTCGKGRWVGVGLDIEIRPVIGHTRVGELEKAVMMVTAPFDACVREARGVCHATWSDPAHTTIG